MEILSLDWNGFPFKARHAGFESASENVCLSHEKKKNDATLFVMKTPCDQCTPLISMEKIKTAVVEDDVIAKRDCKPKWKLMSYATFPNMVEKNTSICF